MQKPRWCTIIGAIILIGSVNLCKVILTFKSVDEILVCDL